MDVTSGSRGVEQRDSLPAKRHVLRRVATVICVVAFSLGLIVSAIAWLLPFHARSSGAIYEVLFAIAFLTRVFLLPVAAG